MPKVAERLSLVSCHFALKTYSQHKLTTFFFNLFFSHSNFSIFVVVTAGDSSCYQPAGCCPMDDQFLIVSLIWFISICSLLFATIFAETAPTISFSSPAASLVFFQYHLQKDICPYFSAHLTLD